MDLLSLLPIRYFKINNIYIYYFVYEYFFFYRFPSGKRSKRDKSNMKIDIKDYSEKVYISILGKFEVLEAVDRHLLIRFQLYGADILINRGLICDKRFSGNYYPQSGNDLEIVTLIKKQNLRA